MARIESSVSASVLAMVPTGARRACGSCVGSVLTNQVWLAIVTAFVAVVIASLVQRVVFGSHVQLFDPLGLGFWQAIVASLMGGLAGHELAIDLREPPESPLIGATSGVIAPILMATFVITLSYN